MSQQFWIGLLIGAIGGGTFGALVMAMLAAAKRGDDSIYDARGILDLNEKDHAVAPGSEADRLARADREYLR